MRKKVISIILHRRKGSLEIQTTGFSSHGLSLQDSVIAKKDEAAQPVSFSNIIENPFTEQHSVLEYRKCVLILIVYISTAGTHEPVRVADFPRHVKSLHANDDYLFTEEYSVRFIFIH